MNFNFDDETEARFRQVSDLGYGLYRLKQNNTTRVPETLGSFDRSVEPTLNPAQRLGIRVFALRKHVLSFSATKSAAMLATVRLKFEEEHM